MEKKISIKKILSKDELMFIMNFSWRFAIKSDVHF